MWSTVAYMSPTLHQAMTTLHHTGRVSLPGKAAIWSSTMRVLFIILFAMIGVVGIGGTIVVVVVSLNDPSIGLVPIFALIPGLLMLGGVTALLVYSSRKRRRYRATEAEPVIIDPNGLTMRGVGPIPWMDFGFAQHKMVPAEHDEGYVRRAVMELSPSGLYNVNERTPPEIREQISPAMGPFWNRHHRYIYVPSVEGLKNKEVIELINAGHRLFAGRR